MELVKILWVCAFFLFALILLFVWSKVYTIGKKVKASRELLSKIDQVVNQVHQGGQATGSGPA